MSQHRESHVILILSTWTLSWMPFTFTWLLLYTSPRPFPHSITTLPLSSSLSSCFASHHLSPQFIQIQDSDANFPISFMIKTLPLNSSMCGFVLLHVDISEVMSRQISTPLLCLPIGIPYALPVILCINLWWKPFLASPIPRSPFLPLY